MPVFIWRFFGAIQYSRARLLKAEDFFCFLTHLGRSHSFVPPVGRSPVVFIAKTLATPPHARFGRDIPAFDS